MAIWWTLGLGAVAWWMAVGIVDSRVAMGRGGPWVYFGVWCWLAALMVWNDRAWSRAPEALRIRSSATRAYVLGAPLVGVLGWVVHASRVGDSWVSGALTGWVFMLVVGPAAFLVAGILARRRVRAERTRGLLPRCGPLFVLLALSPLLSPWLANVAHLLLPAPEWWAVRIAPFGRAGLQYLAMVPLFLPAAVVVAWGLDRFMDIEEGPRARGAVLLAALVMLGAVPFLPELIAWADGLGGRTVFRLTPFRTSYGGQRFGLLPHEGLYRATAAMMLATSLLTTVLVARRGSLPARAPVAILFVVQLALTAPLLARWGPLGAPLASVIGCAAAGLWLVLRHRTPRRAP